MAYFRLIVKVTKGIPTHEIGNYWNEKMGTMIHLSVGGFQVDWGKNSTFNDHSALFQKSDLGQVPDLGYEEAYEMEGYSRPLGATVKRLELLGYTLDNVRRRFRDVRDEWGVASYYPRTLPFRKFFEIASKINLKEVTGRWSEDTSRRFVPDQILEKLGYDAYGQGRRPDYWELERFFGGLPVYSILRILAENPENLDVPVRWPFGALVDSGWAKSEDFLSDLSTNERFLIVTEGSSDSKVIQKALTLLRPEIADFFRFIDMEDGYPFSGTGNLFLFTRGLISIGFATPTIILYDNDAEGVRKYEEAKKLRMPPNMVVTKLPDLSVLRKFNTIGPYGSRKCNINGSAASIECYLDLTVNPGEGESRVRWSSYGDKIDKYQGAIEGKTGHVKRFLRLKGCQPGYDFSKVEAVLEHIYKMCVRIKNKID